MLLQTRSSRALVGAGWAALAFEILTPAAFFLLMCLPKYYFDVKPQPIPTQLFQAVDLDQPNWANRYAGMTVLHPFLSVLGKCVLPCRQLGGNGLSCGQSLRCNSCHACMPACLLMMQSVQCTVLS